MRSLVFRVQATGIWLAAAIALLSALTLFFYEPGVIEEAVGGTMEGEEIVPLWGYMMNGFVVIPLVMAVATLLLNDRASAWGTAVVGGLFGAYGLFAVISETVGGAFHAHMAMTLVAVALLGLNVGLSITRLRHRIPLDDDDIALLSIRADVRHR
ncbi:hypothetical protein QQX13_09295 [Demequina sp. SYSU T00068]|uniref:hypothetical protein n=1 Tax=Demequina lignilytica TaxID=3051663 RepID=UPI0026229A4D|nr:hypothetical protein [Demequina sp. SYSU T00068]MDN4491023.1 hypothetical protein [Demequina sp. SYSU T00068]